MRRYEAIVTKFTIMLIDAILEFFLFRLKNISVVRLKTISPIKKIISSIMGMTYFIKIYN